MCLGQGILGLANGSSLGKTILGSRGAVRGVSLEGCSTSIRRFIVSTCITGLGSLGRFADVVLEFPDCEPVCWGPNNRGMLGKVPLAEDKCNRMVELMMLWTFRVSML